MWIIEDWCGNRMFPGSEFASFDEAWSFIEANVPESDWDDVYVEKIPSYRKK